MKVPPLLFIRFRTAPVAEICNDESYLRIFVAGAVKG